MSTPPGEKPKPSAYMLNLLMQRQAEDMRESAGNSTSSNPGGLMQLLKACGPLEPLGLEDNQDRFQRYLAWRRSGR